MARREKVTVELEPDLRKSLARWARDEGRPVGNLLRRLLAISVAQREQQPEAAEK
jgi:hypothetical protein